MKFLQLLIITILSVNVAMAQSTDEEYIARFAKIAVEEMQIYGIPASITLAQGLLETADGQSELAQNANNHFGIKCKKEWTGATYRYTDDAYMECFRKYNSAEESYRDHSKFLAERPYYKALFTLDKYDYKAWAHGLKKAGYATNPRYAPLLISKIEKYNLQQFDRVQPNEVNAKIAQLYPNAQYNNVVVAAIEAPQNIETEEIYPESDPVQEIPKNTEVRNEPKNTKENPILTAPDSRVHPYERIERHSNKKLKYITVLPGETLNKIASEYNISTETLQNYNDITNPNLIKVDEVIFLQQKKNKGSQNTYVAKQGDTWHSISQQQGIQLKYLLKRNRLKNPNEIQAGQIIYLKGKKKK